jgi:hypothetical protein
MSDATTDNVVKITEARFIGSRAESQPRSHPEAKDSFVHHVAWVGNDNDGWVQIPHITNIDINLRQGDTRKAVITVLFPQVEFEGGRP